MEGKKEETSCIYGGKKIAVLFTLGTLLILAGCTCYPLIDSVIQNKISSQLVLSPTSQTFKEWEKPDVPIYLQFFVFNVENPDEVKQGKVPFVSQKGPYSYKEYRHKENITWCDENSTVSYDEKQWFVFDPTTTCSNCDPYKDRVVTTNIVLVTLANMIKDLLPNIKLLKKIVGDFFSFENETLFHEISVHELLWGYKDQLFQKYNELWMKSKILQVLLPKMNPYIALQQNSTFQGATTVYTGAKDIERLVKWKEWNGKCDVGVWKTSYANQLNGSDGTQFPPKQNTDSTLYVFVTQLCRSFFLTYEKPSKVHGIDTLVFTVPKKLFLNSTLDPDNQAFCTKRCYPTGILDADVCQKAPISPPLFVSAPHFYLGDKSLTQNVHGLSPNKKDHGTFMEIETHLGVPLKSAKRLQMNVYIEPLPYIISMKNIKSVFLPIMYVNETSTIDSSQAEMLKEKVLLPFLIVHYVELAVIIVGGILVLSAVILLVLLIRRNRKLKQIKTMLTSTASENSPLLVNS